MSRACLRLTLAVVGLLTSVGCKVNVGVTDALKITCTAEGECPKGWRCVQETGHCALPGTVCTEDRDGRLHASADGNPCALSSGEPAICVAGACLPSSCGDGVVDARNEVCDDPGGNSDTQKDACRTNCTPARCGDGITDTAEDCDDANVDETDTCLNTCTLNYCGATGVLCAEGQRCASGVCRDTCTVDEDCDADRLCEVDVCLPKIPPVISFATASLSFFAGAQPVDIVPLVDPGPQATSAIVSWSWVVAPDAFPATAPPDGPSLTFSPDVVGSYALEATATHRGGSTSNTLILQVQADRTIALMNAGGGASIVEFFTDGDWLALMPDFLGVQAEAGLQALPGHNAVFAGAMELLLEPNFILYSESASSLESEGDAPTCVGAGKVWAIADDGTGACCAAGSSGTLGTFSAGSYGCCKRGFQFSSNGSCDVTRPRPPTALVTTTADTTLSFAAQPALAGPLGDCDWTDLPPAPIDPNNVSVKLCHYEIRTLSSAQDGSTFAFVLSRRFVPDVQNLPGRAGVAVIVGAPEDLATAGVDAGLPNAGVVLLSTEVDAADLTAPPLSYLRLAHSPSGARLAVLSGPMDVLANKSASLQPSAIADYSVTIYDPVSRASLAASGGINMRATWRAALLLLPSDRMVLSPDGLSVRIGTVGATPPTLTTLWASPAQADYIPLPASAHPALACAPLCDNYSLAPAPDLGACANACCTCMAQSAMTDPAVVCLSLAGAGDTGVSISIYDGISRNAAGTLLSASKTTTLIPFGRCNDIFLFETATDLVRIHELVTYDVATAGEVYYSIPTLTGGDPTQIARVPSTGFLANDTQLSFSLRLQGNPTPPPRFTEFWVLNRNGSRPRQLLPDGATFYQQTNEVPPSGCAALAPGSLAPLGALLLAALVRRHQRQHRVQK